MGAGQPGWNAGYPVSPHDMAHMTTAALWFQMHIFQV